VGVYSARRTYDLADSVGFNASNVFLNTTSPNTRGIPDLFRVDFIEYEFNGTITDTAGVPATTIDVDTVAEFMSILAAAVSSTRVHSTALGEVVQSLGLDVCVMTAMSAGLPVTIDTDLPFPGQSKVVGAGGAYPFTLQVRIPFFDPNVYRARHTFECHQFGDGGFQATFGTGIPPVLGGVNTWTIQATTNCAIRLVGREMATPTKRTPWCYIQDTTGTNTDINFDAGLYANLSKSDETPAIVTDAGQYDLWIDGQRILTQSDVRLFALLGEWSAARGYDGPGLVHRLLSNEGAGLGAPENITNIPILWRDPRSGVALQPEANTKVQLVTNANFAAVATWNILRAKPMSRIGDGLCMCPRDAKSVGANGGPGGAYDPIPL